MSEDLKRRYLESFRKIWLNSDFNEIEKLFDERCIIETNMGEVEGLEAVKNFFGYWASNFCHMQLESIGEFTDRNNVFIQWKCKGDRVKKPSNEKEVAELELHAMNRSQFEDGKVIRFWFYFNL